MAAHLHPLASKGSTADTPGKPGDPLQPQLILLRLYRLTLGQVVCHAKEQLDLNTHVGLSSGFIQRV